MSVLDTFQHWALEIGGTIIFLLALIRLILDLIAGVFTFDILIYTGVFVLAFLMMGYKGLAKILRGS